MENKICKKILMYAAGTVLGLSFMIIIFSFILCIYGAVNIWTARPDPYGTQICARYSAIALACFIVPVLTGCAFAAFSNKKIFKVIAAALCLALAVMCIVFYAVVAGSSLSSGAYNAVADFFVLMFVMTGASAVLTFFYTISAVFAFKKYMVKETDVGGGE